MRSHRSRGLWLLAKEWRELMSSPAWWVMLILTGPLVGVSFISAVSVYSEASGLGGTTRGIGQAFSPLVGVWAPTFSAYEIVAVFLLPFVAIRLVAGDRQSGVMKLELQQSMPPLTRIIVKTVVLMAGWLATGTAGAACIALWMSYGGHTYAPEMFSVVLGHLLNAGLTIAFAVAAAAITEHPSTAAIVTFAFTVGTWVIHFIAAVHGGLWERMTSYTPASLVAYFQRGLVQMNVVLIAFSFVFAGLTIAAVWLRLGVPFHKRVWSSVLVGTLAAGAIFSSAFVRANWDLSESRQNSFSSDSEAVLKQIKAPLTIEAHLAPQDGRRSDLERQTLSKLRRVMPDLRVQYVSATSIGLFEQTADHYGEVWYDMNGRRTMNRLTTPEAVLDTIFELANVRPPQENENSAFPGYPLLTPPSGAAAIFYGFWPVVTGGAALLALRRKR